TKALQNVAVNLWHKIEARSFGSTDNIFSALSSELQRDGFDKSSANQKAVEILGAIGTGGAQFAGRVNRDEIINFPASCKAPNHCNLNSVFMAAIAEGMVHADTLKMMDKEASPYSLPAGAGFPCDSGKSYHFWMAAVLEQELEKKGHSQ